MFKQVKSMFFWSLLYKFRKRLTIVAFLLSIVLLSQWIYSDIVEYLSLTGQTSFISMVLIIKWSIIFFNISLSSFLVLTLFKSQKSDKQEKKKETTKEKTKVDKNSLSPREKEFMSRKIRTEAEIILQKKIAKK